MTDGHHPPDDELVSAYLDGEATPAEVARVEAEPALRARAAELRKISQAVGAVPPTSEAARARHLAVALQARDAGASAATVVDLDRARARRVRSWLLGAAAAVAAVVLAAGVLPTLLDDRDDAQTAAESDAADDREVDPRAATGLDGDAEDPSSGAASEGASPPAVGSSPSTAAEGGPLVDVPDLGSFATHAELEAALARSLAGGAGTRAQQEGAFVSSSPACATAIDETDAEVRALFAAATATLAGQPVEVLLFTTDPASSANGPLRLYLVEPATCAPIADGVRTITR